VIELKEKSEANIRRRGVHSICISKTSRHFRAQVCDPHGVVLCGISTLNKTISKGLKTTGNIEAAKKVGTEVAKLIKKLALNDQPIAFDRSGYIYHGRVAAFVDAMREAGVEV